MRMIDDCRYHLVMAGIPMPDADQLRRIAMTLHRWHEMECGDSNDYCSYSLVRGRKVDSAFEYDDNGKPYLEMHRHSESKTRYEPIADREKGALKRLAAIMARYPGFSYYVQGDPRGASLYILTPEHMERIRDIPGATLDAYYSRGVAVHK